MLTLSVVFLGGTYEASDGAGPEWPPHPGRVFNALVAQADPGTADDTALIWLEEQAPPVVLASEAHGSVLTAFVPTNSVKADKDTHQTYLGRTAGSRSWSRANPRRTEVHLLWPDASPGEEVRRRLAILARRVPYLGRATSPVVVSVGIDEPEDTDLQRWEHPGDGSARLRAPRPGSLANLRAAFDNGEQARTTDRFVAYGSPRPAGEPPEPVLDGPWSELLTFGLPPGRSLDGRLVVRIATAWRSAVLTALGEQFAPSELTAVHGHREAPGGQCAFLPLPFVGHEHADGEIRGLGVALPPDLDRPLRLALLRLLGMDVDTPRLPDFHVPGLADPMALAHGTFDRRSAVTSDRWRPTGGARAWETVLPLVLDRYPHRGEDPADHVRASCRFAGFEEPVDVEVLPASAVAGAARLRGSDLRRRRDDPARPAVHARVVFPDRVRGPVVLGNLRHLGLGLCAPVAGS